MHDHIEIAPRRRPVVSIINGEAMADSRDVAAFFEKRHNNVLRDIDNLLAQKPDLRLRNFEQTYSPVQMPNGGTRTDRHFRMTRDGFVLLAMGFTGSKALDFKLAYIEAFNAMEAELRNRPAGPAQIDVRDPSQLAQIAIQLIEVNKDLAARAETAEKAVEAAKPKTLFYDQFANADGLYGLQNAGRVLGEPPNKFIGWLKQKYLFYQGGALVPRVQYRQMGVFEVKVKMEDDKARYQTYVTPKGIAYLAKQLGKTPNLFGEVA